MTAPRPTAEARPSALSASGPAPDEGPGAALEDLREFLQETASLLGASLALFSPQGRLLFWTGAREAGHDGPPSPELAASLGAGRDGGRSAGGQADFVSVPVVGSAGELGTLLALFPPSRGPRAFTAASAELARFLRGLADLLARLVRERSDLELMGQELATRYDELNLVYQVSERLARTGDLRQRLEFILEESRATTGADWAFVHVADRNILKFSQGENGVGELLPSQQRRLPQLGETLLQALRAAPPQPLVSAPEVEAELRAMLSGRPELLAVPILVKGELQGSLAVVRSAGQSVFSTCDTKLMEALAEQVSLALTNSELYENLRDFLMNSVRSLVSAIDAKDSYTRGHSERVHRISLLLGESLALSAEETEALRWASILHDVGKIAVPEGILGKPGPLTEQETAVMRQHPVRSCEILASITQLAPCLPAIRHHHERYDGGGYPDGLRGENIPRVSRILALADVFDALTSDRSYRRALPPEEVRHYIREAAGGQFDPQVVKAFEELFTELLGITQSVEAAETAPSAGAGAEANAKEKKDGHRSREGRKGHLPHAVPTAA